jgi:hypothetical protein
MPYFTAGRLQELAKAYFNILFKVLGVNGSPMPLLFSNVCCKGPLRMVAFIQSGGK